MLKNIVSMFLNFVYIKSFRKTVGTSNPDGFCIVLTFFHPLGVQKQNNTGQNMTKRLNFTHITSFFISQYASIASTNKYCTVRKL